MKFKTDKNQVLWFNGKKWLVKETCKDNVKSEKLEKDLTDREIQKNKDKQ